MSYEIDGITPASTVKPGSIEELSTELARIHADGAAAAPWGGGTRSHVGNRISSYDVAIDLTGMNGLIEHMPGDLTVAVDAGVTVADLQRKLREAGQRLAFDTPDPERATIGGTVASNALGPMASSSGGIRDWIIGMRVVLADGSITKSGDRKSVV